MVAEARQYPGQEQQVIEFYQKNPQAIAQLRAPIYEEKVVDLIIEKSTLTDKKVSKEILFEEDDMI
jgi:trigger factor